MFAETEVTAFRHLATGNYDYDPLYGTSEWLDIGIAQASRDLLVELPFAAGRWDDIVIRLERDEASLDLDELGWREEFIALANAFVAALRTRTERRNFFELFMAGIRANGTRYWACPREALYPAFRHALAATGYAVLSHPVEEMNGNWVAAWLEQGLAALCGSELVESNSNVFVCDYRIRLTQETAERMLHASGVSAEFMALAKAFLDYLAALPAPGTWGARPGWSADTDPR